MVELTGIEPVIPQCHCGVIPLHHSPIVKVNITFISVFVKNKQGKG